MEKSQLDSFVRSWVCLTKKTKTVFKVIRWYTLTFKHVWVSLPKIAKHCGCNEKTVRRALTALKEKGFVDVHRNPYQSNLYMIPKELMFLDFDNPENFKLSEEEQVILFGQKAQANVHVLGSSKEKEYISTNGTHLHNAKKVQKIFVKVQPYAILDKLPLTETEKQTLTKKFSEAEIVKAYEDYLWYKSQGKKIISPFGFMYDRASAAKKFYQRAA